MKETSGRRPLSQSSSVWEQANYGLAWSYLSRALGLAQSLEHPITPLEPGVRSVAAEIYLLIKQAQGLLPQPGRIDTQATAERSHPETDVVVVEQQPKEGP